MGINWLREHLEKPAVKPRRKRLETDIKDQWSKGNRGEKGDWR